MLLLLFGKFHSNTHKSRIPVGLVLTYSNTSLMFLKFKNVFIRIFFGVENVVQRWTICLVYGKLQISFSTPLPLLHISSSTLRKKKKTPKLENRLKEYLSDFEMLRSYFMSLREQQPNSWSIPGPGDMVRNWSLETNVARGDGHQGKIPPCHIEITIRLRLCVHQH